MNLPFQIRQGDVLLQTIPRLPPRCEEIPVEPHRIVLALGEVTGHAHAIYDHWAADSTAVYASPGLRARLLEAANGERYLEVKATVTLTHEEHTAHLIPPGFYHLPRQMEYSPDEFHSVGD